MTSSRARRLETVSWLLAAALAVVACTPAPFAHAPGGRATGATAAASEAHVAQPLALSAEAVELELLFVVPTGSDAPRPAFSADGRRLAFHGLELERGRGHKAHRLSQVHVLDLRTLEDRVVLEVHPAHAPAQPANTYDPRGGLQPHGGLHGVAAPVAERDLSFAPAFLGERLLFGAERPGSEYDGPLTRQLSAFESERLAVFGPHGAWPRVSADGRRVLLQTTIGLTEVDAQGELLARYPGYFGVWAPQSDRFLAHLTPWPPGANLVAWEAGLWPPHIDVPGDDRGGLYLGHEGELVQVTDSGGRPSWHPDGTRFVYERPAAPGASRAQLTLVEVTLAADGRAAAERELVAQGRAPAVHPGGRFMVYHDAQAGLSLIGLGDGEDSAPGARPLGVAGEEAHFSPDGRLMVVTVAAEAGRKRAAGRDLMVYRLHASTSP